MRLRGIVLIAWLLAWPALAAAQGYADGAPGQSVIRPAGYGWRNHVTVADGPCGHAMPIRADCYDVCRPCGLRPLCFVAHVARTLDCLLPCNLCHGQGYRTGPFHGCILGNRWGCGGCCQNPAGSCFDDVGCGSGPSCGCASCTSTVPALSDPFQDDPLPPKPTAQPAHEVRRAPAPMRTTRSVIATPQRTAATRPSAASPQRTVPTRPSATPPQRTAATRPSATPPQRTTATRQMPTPRPAAAPRPASPYKISTASTRTSSAGSSVSRGSTPSAALQQTSHERAIPEPAPHWIDQSQARPIIRSQSPPEAPAELEIPYNPLRAR